MTTTPTPGNSGGAWLRARWLCDELAEFDINATPAIDPDTGECNGLVVVDPADLRPFLPARTYGLEDL
jgi:hypothetical protein